MAMQFTDCGVRFEHDRHAFSNADGMIEICDGDLDKRKDSGKDEPAKR